MLRLQVSHQTQTENNAETTETQFDLKAEILAET